MGRCLSPSRHFSKKSLRVGRTLGASLCSLSSQEHGEGFGQQLSAQLLTCCEKTNRSPPACPPSRGEVRSTGEVKVRDTPAPTLIGSSSMLKGLPRFFDVLIIRRAASTHSPSAMARVRVLNVAEKNDAAKNIAAVLTGGRAARVRSDGEVNDTNSSIMAGKWRVREGTSIFFRERVSQSSTRSTGSPTRWKGVNAT